MDATECQVTDWYEKGVEDGNRGYSESRIDEHRSACQAIGVEPDAARYEEGRQFGLQAFELLEALRAVHARHGDVQEHNTILVAAGFDAGDSLFAVRRLHHLEADAG